MANDDIALRIHLSCGAAASMLVMDQMITLQSALRLLNLLVALRETRLVAMELNAGFTLTCSQYRGALGLCYDPRCKERHAHMYSYTFGGNAWKDLFTNLAVLSADRPSLVSPGQQRLRETLRKFLGIVRDSLT